MYSENVTARHQAELRIIPLTLRQANDFVAAYHRHHKEARGCKFAIGVVDASDMTLHGVAICSRPIARAYDDGFTAEVVRTCTDGTKNANSCLYGAAWRVAKAMGYMRLITYTQEGETGTSLTASGWRVVAQRPARKSWGESSVKLRSLRDPVGSGGVSRTLWEQTA